MTNKPAGNPRNGRRLQGVPKAGPLYVNGVKTPKGNVQKAVSQMYSSASRSLANAEGQLGPMEIVAARDLDDDPTIVCWGCGDWFTDDQLVTRERATGKVWHMGTDCRKASAAPTE